MSTQSDTAESTWLREKIAELERAAAEANRRAEEADRRYEALVRFSKHERQALQRGLLRELQRTVGRDLEEALVGIEVAKSEPSRLDEKLELIAVSIRNAKRYLDRLAREIDQELEKPAQAGSPRLF